MVENRKDFPIAHVLGNLIVVVREPSGISAMSLVRENWSSMLPSGVVARQPSIRQIQTSTGP